MYIVFVYYVWALLVCTCTNVWVFVNERVYHVDRWKDTSGTRSAKGRGDA